jgi:release factor glutamine methyltransferase
MTLAAFAAGITLAEVLGSGRLVALEVRILASHVLGLSRVQLITQSERVLDAAEAHHLEGLFQRRIDGEPIAYLTGEREFFGLSFAVTPAVLIPRPETELLVDLALERLPQNGSVLDLGTGSGAIPVALAHARPDADVSALDVSAAALAIARKNAQRHQVAIRFHESDWYAALSTEKFHVITANPPYIVAGDAHLTQGDLRFEPLSALTDHDDGLSALRRIIAGAGAFLKPGGWLLLEHGYDQAQAVRDVLGATGMQHIQSWRDLAGIERVTGAQFND